MKHGTQTALHLLLMLVAGVLAAGPSTVNAASAPKIAPGSAADFRAAFATPQDIAEGKRVAAASCASCHGVDGISTTKGVPHIAGQRPLYLYEELRLYQKGNRGNTPMNNAVKFLSDDALVKVAAYYAGLEPAPPAAPAPGSKPAAVKTDPASAGKAAAAGCAGCHGETGISKMPGMPNLVGLDPKYLADATNAYKTGKRKHDMMKTLVSGLSDADINNIAFFYATQKPGKAQTPAPGNQAAGKTAAAACAGCHGEGGVSTSSVPSLAGQDAQYFIAAMRAYKDNSRADPSMKAPASSVDETTIRDMAAYYANQMPQQPKVRKTLTVAEMAQRCDRCHGVNGNSTDLRSPALAAQRTDYLERVLRLYRKGERKSKAMTAMLDGLSDADLDGLAAHYASQKARAVVFVPLPPK
ncbi:MAG: c-type cytochrome [Burkholderiales bacterium]|nr:c-type cytochrome [Burkholderiales bacterium]